MASSTIQRKSRTFRVKNLYSHESHLIDPQVIKKICDIFELLFSAKMRIPISLLQRYIKNEKYDIILLFSGESLIGIATILKNIGLNIIHLDYIGIDLTYRGIGLFKMLMNYICIKYKNLSLECERKLIPIYERFGFINTKINYSFRGKKLNLMMTSPKNINILISFLKNHNSIEN